MKNCLVHAVDDGVRLRPERLPPVMYHFCDEYCNRFHTVDHDTKFVISGGREETRWMRSLILDMHIGRLMIELLIDAHQPFLETTTVPSRRKHYAKRTITIMGRRCRIHRRACAVQGISSEIFILPLGITLYDDIDG